MRRTKPAGCYIGKEDAFQVTSIRLVRIMLQRIGRDPRQAMHVPNGGARSAATGQRLKQQGVVAGYPDIMIFEPENVVSCDRRNGLGDRRCGLALELKVWPNKPKPEQEEVHELLRSAGWRVAVCYGMDEVESEVRRYANLNP